MNIQPLIFTVSCPDETGRESWCQSHLSYNNYSKVMVNTLYLPSNIMIQDRLKPFFKKYIYIYFIFFHVQCHFYFEKSIREWQNKRMNLGRCKTVSRKFFWSKAALFGFFRNGCDGVTNGSVVLLSPFFFLMVLFSHRSVGAFSYLHM